MIMCVHGFLGHIRDLKQLGRGRGQRSEFFHIFFYCRCFDFRCASETQATEKCMEKFKL